MNNHYQLLYTTYLKQQLRLKKPLRVVFDASNGPTGQIIREVLANIPGISYTVHNDTIDPDFSAHGPNPMATIATDACAATVQTERADLGVLFDADGDRAVFVDEKGRVMPAYVIAILLMNGAGAPFVADELVYKSLQHIGFSNNVMPSKVGSRFVKELMRSANASIGAEYSGHYYFRDFFFADSGILTALYVLNALSGQGQSLAAFYESLPQHQMASDEVHLTGTEWKDIEPKIRSTLGKKATAIEDRDGLTLEFGPLWVNMRPSNTEPLVRIIGGADSAEAIKDTIASVKEIVS